MTYQIVLVANRGTRGKTERITLVNHTIVYSQKASHFAGHLFRNLHNAHANRELRSASAFIYTSIRTCVPYFLVCMPSQRHLSSFPLPSLAQLQFVVLRIRQLIDFRTCQKSTTRAERHSTSTDNSRRTDVRTDGPTGRTRSYQVHTGR
jgi:hypothetical protein